MKNNPQSLHVFENLTLDGFFCGEHGDLSWAYQNNDDPEFQEFTSNNASGGGSLLFGRKTYDMMAGFWPTAAAMQQMPAVAKGMNAMQKYVVSNTMDNAAWQNTSVIQTGLVENIQRLKETEGTGITILGSGSIVSQLVEAGLVDTIQLVISPVVIGKGRSLFAGVSSLKNFKLEDSRTFKNGKLVVWYKAA